MAHRALADPTTDGSRDSGILKSSSRVLPVESIAQARLRSWDDVLTSLCAMKPNLKLNDVDIMAKEQVLIKLMGIALRSQTGVFNQNAQGFAIDMSLINNTLVLQNRLRYTHPPKSPFFDDDYYEAATVAVPGAEHSPVHNQLLRYNIGPLSLAVHTKVNGSVQRLPTAKEPSGPLETRDVHGIDVITAGKGVLPHLTFQVSPRFRDSPPNRRRERELIKKWVPRLWVSGQTKIGVAHVSHSGQGAASNAITVVELGDRVREFEHLRQHGLRRLPGLLAMLRDTVRAHGGPCVAVFFMPRHTGSPGPTQSKGSPRSPGNYTLQVHSSGPREVHVLSDWQKEHFWSKGNVPNDHIRSRGKAVHQRARPRKSAIRQWVH